MKSNKALPFLSLFLLFTLPFTLAIYVRPGEIQTNNYVIDNKLPKYPAGYDTEKQLQPVYSINSVNPSLNNISFLSDGNIVITTNKTNSTITLSLNSILSILNITDLNSGDANFLNIAFTGNIFGGTYHGDASQMTGLPAGTTDTTLDTNNAANVSWLGKQHTFTADLNLTNCDVQNIYGTNNIYFESITGVPTIRSFDPNGLYIIGSFINLYTNQTSDIGLSYNGTSFYPISAAVNNNDLGTSGLRWRNLFLRGDANILLDANIGRNFSVLGNTFLNNAAVERDLNVTRNILARKDLNITDGTSTGIGFSADSNKIWSGGWVMFDNNGTHGCLGGC